jgi:hypothetical protein
MLYGHKLPELITTWGKVLEVFVVLRISIHNYVGFMAQIIPIARRSGALHQSDENVGTKRQLMVVSDRVDLNMEDVALLLRAQKSAVENPSIKMGRSRRTHRRRKVNMNELDVKDQAEGTPEP